MANTKITQLTTTASANGADLMVIVTDTAGVATTKSILVSDLFGNVTANVNFNSNVSVAQSKNLLVGNSTVNTVITQSSVTVANSSKSLSVSSSGVTTGLATINATGVYVGGNSVVNSSMFFQGTATSNLVANSTIVRFSNTTATANMSVAGFVTGSSLVNSSGIYVGANVAANTTALKVGSFVANSTTITFGTNVSVNSTAVAFGTTSRANNTTVVIGNSTVNSVMVASSLTISNSSSNVTVSIPSQAQASATNVFLHANSTWSSPEEHLIVDVSRDESTTLTSGSGKFIFHAPFAMTLTRVPVATVSTNSTSGAVSLDITEAGVSILSTALTIDANEPTSKTAATAAVLSDTGIADDARVSINVSSAGTGAKGLKVIFYYRRT